MKEKPMHSADLPYSREQLEAARHEMIRRYTKMSLPARTILEELISHDIPDKETGMRKGEVWCSQKTISDNLGISRCTVNRHIKQVIDSPFINQIRKFKAEDGTVHLAYTLEWRQLALHTAEMLDRRKSRK